MAYFYTAVYGDYADQNLSGHGYIDLNGTNINDTRYDVVSPSTLYSIAESTELPSPVNTTTNVTYEEALPRIRTLTEYNYTTLIPYVAYDADFLASQADRLFNRVEVLMEGPFYYSRWLLAKAVALYAWRHTTFVWLTDINIIIDYMGAMYTVDPDTGDVTKIANANLAFGSSCIINNFNPTGAPQFTTSGETKVSFIYGGSFYQNRFGMMRVEDRATEETIMSRYTIWAGTNTTSTIQNILHDNLIGTPSDPKYKYKTDPTNPETDPYIPPLSPSTPSTPGGGEGTHNPNPGNDPAPIPDITQMTSILDTEFMTAYKMTATGLKNLGSFLWSQSFYGVIANVLSSPFDVIIGLHIVPVVPTIEDSARTILLGNVDSLIAARRVTSQYVEKDLGGFDVPHIWGAYLDYQGKFEIFLPFIGFRSIAADDIVGHEIRVKYHIDVITGACIAYVLTDDYVTYTFAGSCSYNIPITGQNFTNIVSSIIQTAGTIGMAAIAPEGMGAAGAMAVAGSSLNTAMTKPTYSRSGGMGGNSGFMGMRTPVLIARVPNIAIPGHQNKITGYPSFITRKLSELSGYTEVYKIHLEGIGATDTEKAEIERALMEGVEL